MLVGTPLPKGWFSVNATVGDFMEVCVKGSSQVTTLRDMSSCAGQLISSGNDYHEEKLFKSTHCI